MSVQSLLSLTEGALEKGFTERGTKKEEIGKIG
jgi:hypothetical protein